MRSYIDRQIFDKLLFYNRIVCGPSMQGRNILRPCNIQNHFFNIEVVSIQSLFVNNLQGRFRSPALLPPASDF